MSGRRCERPMPRGIGSAAGRATGRDLRKRCAQPSGGGWCVGRSSGPGWRCRRRRSPSRRHRVRRRSPGDELPVRPRPSLHSARDRRAGRARQRADRLGHRARHRGRRRTHRGRIAADRRLAEVRPSRSPPGAGPPPGWPMPRAGLAKAD